jgi:GNAT superfamily N-acetyltransferase
MEARPIREDEAETFLRLLCDVFELDYSRAHGVFMTEPFFDLERKWALFEDGRMRSILTLTPLRFGWGVAVGVSGVATHPRYRGQGLAGRLLEAALGAAYARGEQAAYLFADDPRLYLRHGFAPVDRKVRGPILVERGPAPGPSMEFERVRAIYDGWASEHPDRLRRTEAHWQLWKWHMRSCEQAGEGYVCHEAGLVREALGLGARPSWPVLPEAEWIGLAGLTEALSVPLLSSVEESHLLARGTLRVPQMFLTDQF